MTALAPPLKALDRTPPHHPQRNNARTASVVIDGRRYRVVATSTALLEHYEALAHIGSPDVAANFPHLYRAVLARIRRRKADARRPSRSGGGSNS